MPLYKDKSAFVLDVAPEFEAILKPHSETPVSGIYQCVYCGHEIVSVKGAPLPPTRDTQGHDPAMCQCSPQKVAWRLVAAAIHQQRDKHLG